MQVAPRHTDDPFPPLSRKIVLPGDVVFRLPHGGVRGRLLDAAGKPMAGERLVLHTNGRRTRTGAHGRFLLEAVPAGRTHLSLGPLRVHEVEVPAHGLIDIEVRVPGSAAIEGRLTADAEFCHVHLMRSDDGRQIAHRRIEAGEAFHLDRLPAGTYDVLLATREGPDIRRRVTLSPDTTLDLGTVELTVHPRVPITVTLPAGAKRPTRLRALTGKRSPARSIDLDGMQRGTLTSFPAGDYMLTFRAPGLRSEPMRVRIARGAPAVVVRLENSE